MESLEGRDRTRHRHEHRLALLRRRAALGSAFGFVVFLGLAAQHAVGATKRAPKSSVSPAVVAPTTYFDRQADAFAFDDGSSAPLPPPVAQTNVS